MTYEGTYRIVTMLSISEVEARLRAATDASLLSLLQTERVMGRITGTKFYLWHLIPWFGNSFAPSFHGNIKADGDNTILEGEFRMNWFTKITTTLWFAFFILWTALATIMGPSSAMVANNVLEGVIFFLFPVFGVGMLSIGYYFVRFCKRLGEKDISYITAELEKIVHGESQHSARPER